MTLLNPRGIHQHLTFFTSSRETAIWAITDEWTHFNPFVWEGYGDAVSLPAWCAANAVGACFLLAAALEPGAILETTLRGESTGQ